MKWTFFEEPYQRLFVCVHSVMLVIFYSIAYVLPYLSRFARASNTKAVSDDFYKECSSQFLHTEYYEAQQTIDEIQNEIRKPFCPNGREVGVYKIMSPFKDETQR